MKWIKWVQPFWLLFLLLLFWKNDPLYLARFSVLAALLHEGGHIMIYYLLTGKLPLLRISPFGMAMEINRSAFTARELLLLAAAGPAMNFLAAGLTLLAMQLKAAYVGYCFAAVNLAMGGFNLLPVQPLDGGEILQNLLHKG